jgi:hypothetical protein
MTSTQPYVNKGSGTIISGTPSIIGLFEDTLSVYMKSLDEAIKQTEEQESTIFKEQLSSHPDWADKMDDAIVSVNEGHFNYEVNHPDAMDIEYGNPSRKVVATGFLRSTAKNREYSVNESLLKNLSDRLPNA